MIQLTILLIVFAIVSPRHLPDYIKPCSKSELVKCALENAKAAYPFVVKGDPNYEVPNLSPFHIPSIEVDSGGSIDLKLTNLIVDGLEHLVIKAVDFDLDKKIADFEAYGEYINFQGHYDGTGTVMVINIKGSGKSNVTFVGVTFRYTFNWDIENKNGEDHMEVKDPKMDVRIKGAHFEFENLIGTDSADTKYNMNEMLNENWEAVWEEVREGIGHTIEMVVTEILSGYFEHIPYNELFSD